MKAPRNCQAPHPRRETCSGQVDHQCVGTRPAAPHIQLAWPWLWVWCWPRLAGVCYLHWSFHEPMRLPVPGLHPKQFADQFLAADEWTPRTSWKSRKGGKGRKGSEQIDWKGAWCGSVFPSWFGDASKHLRHVGGLGTAARCTKSDAFPFQNIRKICAHLQVCKWFSYKLMDLLTMDEFGISYILYVFYIYIYDDDHIFWNWTCFVWGSLKTKRSATAASCEVTVPFATIMLENCMPLLASRGSWSPAVALPGPPGFSVARQVQAKHGEAAWSQNGFLKAETRTWDCWWRLIHFDSAWNRMKLRCKIWQGQSVLEQNVRAKLNDLDRKGLVLGAQVGYTALFAAKNCQHASPFGQV